MKADIARDRANKKAAADSANNPTPNASQTSNVQSATTAAVQSTTPVKTAADYKETRIQVAIFYGVVEKGVFLPIQIDSRVSSVLELLITTSFD